MIQSLRSATLVSSFLLLSGASMLPVMAQAPSTLRVMLNSDVRSTDPGVNRDLNSDAIVVHMVEGLVAYREDTSIGMLLADKVDVSPDGLKYTFTLRDGLTFHNGAKLTSDDVVFAWKRYLDPATQWRCITEFDGRGAAKVTALTAPDVKTVVFEIEKPSAMFLGQMARIDCGGAGIFHRDSIGTDGKWINPVGTGPYAMGEWRRGQFIELGKFAGYVSRGGERDGLTGGKAAHVDKVRFTIIPDGAAAKAALFSNSIDVRPDFSANDIEEAVKRSDVKVQSHPTMELNGILLQVNDPVLKDPRIRRAFALAIDRDALVDAVQSGRAKPVNSPIPLVSPFSGAQQKTAIPFNLAEAKKLVAEAGYKGEPIKMIVTKRFMSLYDGAIFAQAMAKDAGLNVEVEVLEWATQLDRYTKGDYQSMFFSFSARLDPSLSFEMLTGPKATQPRKVWDNAEAIALLRESTITGDNTRRQVIFDDLQRRFVADMPMIPLWNSIDVVATRANITGYKTWAASVPRLWGVKVN